MDSLDGAIQADPGADFLQSQIRLLGEQRTHFAAVGIKDDGFASATVMLGGDIAPAVTALLEELFDHAKRDLVAAGDLIPRSFAAVVGGQDEFAQIHGEGCHRPRSSHNSTPMAMKLYKML